MTSVDETLPISDQDKEKEPVNDEVEANTGGQETQIENNEKEKVNDEEQAPTSSKQQEQTPTEFCEEIKEKTRVQKLFECPKCKKMLTKKTLNYYHECTKNDVPKAKRRPKKQIVLEEIAEEIPERKAPSKASSSSSSTDPLPQADIEDIEDIKPPVQKSYEELRKERLQQRIQQRTVKIQQLFQSAI